VSKPVPEKKPKKVSLVEEVENLDLELKPADVRKYLIRGFEVLVGIAENETQDPHHRFHALSGIQAYYGMIAMKDGLDDASDKIVRLEGKKLDEVKRLRKKPWDEDEEEE
jgi:hypothetical protein